MSLLNKDKADLDKDGKLSSYEQKRGEAIEKSMRERKSVGGAIARAISRAAPKATDDIVKGAAKEFSTTRKVEPKEANEIYQFLKGKVKLDDTDPVSEIEEAALKELKAIADGNRPRSLQLFEVFLDGDIKSLDAFMDAYIKVPTTEGPSLLTDIPAKSRTINNEGGYVDDMERLGLAEGPKGDGGLRGMLIQKDAMDFMKKSGLDDVAYDQMIMDLEDNPELSGFRKIHSQFDRFIQDKESKAVFLNLLKNRDEIFEREEKAHGGAMVPDEAMEENFVDYIIKEALPEDKQMKLKEQLEANPDLSELFDEVVIRASEFTGAGSVDGPGTGTSDDIPARLSDGEFVFTAKAVEQIGADKLMKMMKDAEAAYDDREAMYMGGLMDEPEVNPMQPNEITLNYNIQSKPETVSGATPLLAAQEEEDVIKEEIKKGMLGKPNVRS